MTPITIAKLVLAAAGVIVFLVGFRTGQEQLRWLGMGLVFVAVLLRFVGRRPPPAESDRHGPVGRD